MQAKERICERALVRSGVDHLAITNSRQVPQVAIGTAVLPVEKRAKFLG